MKSPTRSADFDADLRLIKISAIAIVVGAICAVIALVLLRLIGLFTNLLFYQDFAFNLTTPANSHLGWWIIAIPAGGGLLAGLMARYGSEMIRGHGIPEALEAILYGKSRMSVKVAILKPLSSAIVIGSGGPFGAEGPIIMTGGSVGSLIGQAFMLTAIERRILLVAGAAAGMAATFNTPIAAALLAVEMLLFELKPRSLVPVALASATAAAIRPFLLGSGPLFPVEGIIHYTTLGLGSAAVCGLLGGILSAILTWAVYASEDGFRKLPIHWMWWPMIGGLIVGLGGYFQPHALGVGYDVIRGLLNGQFALGAVATLIVVKLAIWALSLGSGTSGGVLAPLLMMGAALGVFESTFLPGGSPLLWPMLSMGAVLAGVMRSPFTAIVFVLELTHKLPVLGPLLITVTFAYGFSVMFMRRSILTEKVARRGRHIFREYSVDPLVTLFVAQLMSRQIEAIPANLTVADADAQYFGVSQAHRAYPVTNEGGIYAGIVTRAEINAWLKRAPETTLAACLVGQKRVVALSGETCRTVATRMARYKLERIAVVNNDEEGKLVGLLSRSDIVRGFMVHYENEQVRERYLTLGRRAHRRVKPRDL
ncbi:MAG TPA: chloride channel protein [Gammaproteobacteria bacterium]|nr:chloride channel protein [Gammaproteobacteria bacterium]